MIAYPMTTGPAWTVNASDSIQHAPAPQHIPHAPSVPTSLLHNPPYNNSGPYQAQPQPLDVEFGPLIWGRDISAQVKMLIDLLPNAHLISHNIRARRGRANHVIASFPTNVAAMQFVLAWQRDTPPQFNRLSVTHAGN